MPLWRLLIWDGRVLALVAAWLLTSCVSMYAEDSKPDEHARTPTAQQNLPTAKDGKSKTANGADSASCKIKSDDPAIATNPGDREEWTKDQIHLGAETTLKEESRSDKYENSRAGADLKCTPHEAATTTGSAMPN